MHVDFIFQLKMMREDRVKKEVPFSRVAIFPVSTETSFNCFFYD